MSRTDSPAKRGYCPRRGMSPNHVARTLTSNLGLLDRNKLLWFSLFRKLGYWLCTVPNVAAVRAAALP
jgi:hypothetical protein